MNWRYIYLGDKHTDPKLKGAFCNPIKRADDKCIVGQSKQLVVFEDGTQHIVLRRRLRVQKQV